MLSPQHTKHTPIINSKEAEQGGSVLLFENVCIRMSGKKTRSRPCCCGQGKEGPEKGDCSTCILVLLSCEAGAHTVSEEGNPDTQIYHTVLKS